MPTPAVLPTAVLPTQHARDDDDDSSDTSVSGDSQPIGSSDDDSEESVDSDTSSEDEVFRTPSGDAWQKDANYSPLEAPLQKFQDHFTSTSLRCNR